MTFFFFFFLSHIVDLLYCCIGCIDSFLSSLFLSAVAPLSTYFHFPQHPTLLDRVDFITCDEGLIAAEILNFKGRHPLSENWEQLSLIGFPFCTAAARSAHIVDTAATLAPVSGRPRGICGSLLSTCSCRGRHSYGREQAPRCRSESTSAGSLGCSYECGNGSCHGAVGSGIERRNWRTVSTIFLWMLWRNWRLHSPVMVL